MSTDEMAELTVSLAAGDSIVIVFNTGIRGDEMRGRLGHFLMMCTPVGKALDLGMGIMNLMAVAETGRWCGFSTYIATILPGFDAEYFNHQFVYNDTLESLTRQS